MDDLDILAAELARGPDAANVYVNTLPIPPEFQRAMEKRGDKWKAHLEADDAWHAAND